MEITTIKPKVDLLKQVNSENFVTISELSREIKSSKTDLMKFINDNPKLFALSERWMPKKKKVTTTFAGRKYKEEVTVRGRHLGTCIDNAYLSAQDNYRTKEWLDVVMVEKSRYLFIKEADNYGYIEGYYIDIDTEGHEFRYHLWRNTKEKIGSIKEYLSSQTFYIGGYGDSSSYTKEYAISESNIKKLKELGWSFNDIKPLSK